MLFICMSLCVISKVPTWKCLSSFPPPLNTKKKKKNPYILSKSLNSQITITFNVNLQII